MKRLEQFKQWYDTPLKVRKSTIIILLLIGYILWGQLAHAITPTGIIQPAERTTSKSEVSYASEKGATPFSATKHKDLLLTEFDKHNARIKHARLDKENHLKALQAAEQARAVQVAAQAQKPAVAPPSTSGCTTYHSTGALEQLILHESGGNSCATNPGGCFGLLQACPGAPLRAACGGNPSCQIAWFIANKTGGRSWDQIWALWQTQGWW